MSKTFKKNSNENETQTKISPHHKFFDTPSWLEIFFQMFMGMKIFLFPTHPYMTTPMSILAHLLFFLTDKGGL